MDFKKIKKTELIQIIENLQNQEKKHEEQIDNLVVDLKNINIKYFNLVNQDDSNIQYLKKRISQTQNEKKKNYINALEKYLE